MNNLNNQDPNRHIPSAAETGSVDKFAKQFRVRHGTFSDAEGENIVIFARNADKFMRQHLIPSLEMGMIIIYNLKGEPYTRAKRWRDTMDIDPERVNADHWCEQDFQPASPYMHFQPMQLAQEQILQRDAGIDVNGQPDPTDPGHPGQVGLPYIAMRPPVPAVREQVAVTADHCLRAYLLHTFQKRIDINAAEKFLATFRTQQAKQTCTDFIDAFVTKFEYYTTVRWTAADREAPNFRVNANAIRLQYIRDGLCREFKKHLDANPNIVTQQQTDDEAQRWARETIDGREFTKNCKKSEASHATSSMVMDSEIAEDEEDEEAQEHTSATSGDRGRGNPNRGRGGGARGGKIPNNLGRAPPKNSGPGGTKKQSQSKDAENIYNFMPAKDGTMLLNHRGHPMCYYCGIPSHQRFECRLRLRDVDNGIKRHFHPARGNLPSGNQLRKEALMQVSNAADQWGNPYAGLPTSQPQGPQWPTNNNQPMPMTVVITDPEDQKWLQQATSSGCDPASVITQFRQRQQQHSRSLPPVENNIRPHPTVSSILPSGLVACNECAQVSATLEQSDNHYIAEHLKSANRPTSRN
jgi:hypothetical protein